MHGLGELHNLGELATLLGMTSPPTPAPPDFLSAAEASRITGQSTSSLARLFDSGAIEGYRTTGGQRRYRRTAVLAIVAPPAHPANPTR